MTIPNLLYKAYKENGEKTAIIQRDRKVTYRMLYETVSTLARNFIKLGLKKDDKVCLMLDNNLEYIQCFSALVSIGCIVIPIDKNIKSELNIFAENSKFKMIIIEDDVSGRLLPEIELLPFLEHIYVNSLTRPNPEFHDLKELLSDYSENEEFDIRGFVEQDDTACIIYTSGTIKKPKGVVLSHFNLVFNVIELKEAVEVDAEDVFFNVLPFYHCYGLCTNLLLPFYIQAQIILHDNYSLRDIIGEMKRSRATVASFVPTMLSKIKKILSQETCLHHIKYISSGAPLPGSLIQYYYDNFGIGIINAYGSSETNTIAINKKCYASKKLSAGTLLPSIDIKIINENNESLPFNEEGEIVLKTPKLMKGYYRMPEETRQVVRDDWFYTGDIGYITAEREIFITGRKKDMFCVAGKKVFRHDVEEVLISSGYFKCVYVDSENCESRGEKVIAHVVLKNLTITENDILKYCRRQMAAHKVPRSIYFCDELQKRKTWKTNI